MINLKKILFEAVGPPNKWDELDDTQKQSFKTWWTTLRGTTPSDNLLPRYYADMKMQWWSKYNSDPSILTPMETPFGNRSDLKMRATGSADMSKMKGSAKGSKYDFRVTSSLDPEDYK